MAFYIIGGLTCLGGGGGREWLGTMWMFGGNWIVGFQFLFVG